MPTADGTEPVAAGADATPPVVDAGAGATSSATDAAAGPQPPIDGPAVGGREPVEVSVTEVSVPPPPGREVRPASNRLSKPTRYTVKRGDTLYRIARRYGVKLSDLERWNPQASSRIRPGMVLVIQPTDRGGRADAMAQLGPQGAKARSADRERAARDADHSEAGKRIVHRVRRGDTLYTLARRHNVTVEQLRQWNGIRSSRIVVGERLVFFPDAEGSATP
jgi:membrane-bound lytic murein transglycosylase D